MDGQENHRNAFIIFEPTVETRHGPVKTLDELTELAIGYIVPAKDDHATGKLVATLKKALRFWMKRAVLNERERVRLALGKHGMKEAQHAMMDGADG